MSVVPAETIAEFLERHKTERLAAGLPEHVEDPDVLDRIADMVLRTPSRQRYS